MKRWMMVAAMGTLLVACDKENDDTVNAQDREFVLRASISNTAEVMAGQLAAAKAESDAVRAFGQSMVTEHSKAQQDLKTRAAEAGLNATDTVDAEHQLLMARLNSLSGYSFDTAYINSQVKGHAQTLQFFDNQINNGRHERIRSYAGEYRRHIQMHYNKADSLQRLM